MTPIVKICCISSLEEAELAVDYGASALGLVSEMPSGPGVISEERIAEIAGSVPPGIDTFLLTSLRTADEIVEQHRRCRTTTIQLVDTVEKGIHRILKKALPGVTLVQVIHVSGKASIDESREAARSADALLLDSGNPGKDVKELGGTGRTHNWNISQRIVKMTDKPVFLAGGLNPGNVAEAVAKVRPYGVDVCSGLRTNSGLDASKMADFFQNLRTSSQYS